MPESEVKIGAPGASATGDVSSPTKSSTENAASTITANVVSEPPPPAAATVVADNSGGGGGGGDDEDMLLVTEFPPPPYYYTLASRQTPAHLRLTPPEIPHRAFRVAAKKVNAERKKAREESERIRMEAEKDSAAAADGVGVGKTSDGNSGDADKAKASSSESPMKSTTDPSKKEESDDDDSIDPDDPNETVVAVFGEIVEDPTLVVEEECHDPVEIRENVKRLNRSVLNGFLKLVQKLVNDPNDNKKLRDELSHNLFLMLQECNKFREHQAREILITTLEEQLECRREGLATLKKQIGEADDALAALNKFREN